MKTFGVAEAKRRFGELLDRVARGERFVIERRGKPAVALVLPEEARRERPRARGVLSLVGLFADWKQSDVEAMLRDIYGGRRRARDRPAPKLR
jgi:prevent-host-death family protein